MFMIPLDHFRKHVDKKNEETLRRGKYIVQDEDSINNLTVHELYEYIDISSNGCE